MYMPSMSMAGDYPTESGLVEPLSKNKLYCVGELATKCGVLWVLTTVGWYGVRGEVS